MGSFIQYTHKILRKTNVSYSFISLHYLRTYAYLGVRNIIFLEKFVYVLN